MPIKEDHRGGVVAAAADMVMLLIYVLFISGWRWMRLPDSGTY